MDESEQRSSAAINTLALLELLLAQPTAVPKMAPNTSLQLEDIQAKPSETQAAITFGTDQQLEAVGPSQLLPTPSDIWTEAWHPLELHQSMHTKQAHDTVAAHQMPRPMPSLRFWRPQQQQQGQQHLQEQQQSRQHQQQQHTQSSQKGGRRSVWGPPSLAGASPMKKAQMQLQGIEPGARLQLIPLCMASLENLTEALQAQDMRCVYWHQDQHSVQVHD